MRAILLGGAPGVGKSSAARELLALAASGSLLTQWVDVDDLWLHQPWRVDAAMRGMLHDNLEAVLGNASRYGMDVVLVTWVFQNAEMQRLVRDLLPEGTACTTVQLRVQEATWRRRFGSDPARPAIDPFFEDRYRSAQSTEADHVIDTDDRTPREVASELMLLLQRNASA